MNRKIIIPYQLARRFLLEILTHNDLPLDEELLNAFKQEKAHKPQQVMNKKKTLSRIRIDKDCKIFLSDYSNREVDLAFLPKTIFFFYLIHPDGVEIKRLYHYTRQLYAIYQIVAVERNIEADKIKQCLANQVQWTNNRIYETCSIIRKAFMAIVNPEDIQYYCITGKKGGTKKIKLDRNLVFIESEKLKDLIDKTDE